MVLLAVERQVAQALAEAACGRQVAGRDGALGAICKASKNSRPEAAVTGSGASSSVRRTALAAAAGLARGRAGSR